MYILIAIINNMQASLTELELNFLSHVSVLDRLGDNGWLWQINVSNKLVPSMLTAVTRHPIPLYSTSATASLNVKEMMLAIRKLSDMT
jgi:hypothetical protein